MNAAIIAYGILGAITASGVVTHIMVKFQANRIKRENAILEELTTDSLWIKNDTGEVFKLVDVRLSNEPPGRGISVTAHRQLEEDSTYHWDLFLFDKKFTKVV